MWVNDEQRVRIFEMIGTHSVTHHRVRNVRLDHQRRLLVLFLVAAAAVWIGISTL